MSKKKDRINQNYRNCHCCGRKGILVYAKRKFFRWNYYIYCYKCRIDILVKTYLRKEQLDYIEAQKLLRRNRDV